MNPAAGQIAPAEVVKLTDCRSADIDAVMKKYPDRRSGVMGVLWIAQEERGWISPDTMEEVAGICDIQPSEVMELVTFYTMYHRRPVGKYVLGVCGTMPCALCGAEGLLSYLKGKLGVDLEQTTPDGLFTIKKMECLGACSEAPLMLVNKTLAINLTRKRVDELIEGYRKEGESKITNGR